MRKIIVHIDLNTFFVRCEEIKDPSLEHKAVGIGHLGRSGIISTCSYEAREKGVRSGMPTFQAVKLCPHLILKPVDFDFYLKKSSEFQKFLQRYTSIIHMASIDEAYADFSETLKDVKDVVSFFRKLQQDLYKETQLKCSIGVATTLFLAKMGSDYKKPQGITIIRNRDIKDILYPLPIEDMYGIGKKTAPRLKGIGIDTIGDLKEHIDNHDPLLESIFGKYLDDVKKELVGESNDIVPTEDADPKSIGNSSTLTHDTANPIEIEKMLLSLSKEVARRAKKEEKIGYTVQITVKDTSFISHNKSKTFETPTNDEGAIYEISRDLYHKNFDDVEVRLVGVTLQNLISIRDMAIQMSLFDYEKYEEESETKLLINELNRKFKKDVLTRMSDLERK
ncbi:MAG: DNA polymerase IV [Coprobacillus sp.]|nr:DNA polymerase IV [Coprobacillus sp.]